jgi:hypothetical protein
MSLALIEETIKSINANFKNGILNTWNIGVCSREGEDESRPADIVEITLRRHGVSGQGQ